MTSNREIQLYTLNNEPLPESLKLPLFRVLDHLDQSLKACKRSRMLFEDAIEERRSVIESLESEIRGLEMARNGLVRTGEALRAKKTLHTSTLSPLRRVPSEVIATIIRFAIQAPSMHVGWVERQDFMHIRSVCRLWRRTAFSTPDLWRSVELESSELPRWHYGGQAQGTDAIRRCLISWLSRGGEHAPLSLHILGSSPENMRFLFNIIGASGLNVTSMFFGIDWAGRSLGHPSNLSLLKAPLDNPLKLKILLVHFQYSEDQAFQGNLGLERNFPHLSLFTLSFEHCSDGRKPLRLPVSIHHSTLSHLEIFGVSFLASEAATLLRGLPQLKELGLTRCDAKLEDDDGALGASQFTHPSLTTLAFHNTLPEALLSGLICPSITTISIYGLEAWENQDWGIGRLLHEFLERLRSQDLIPNLLENTTTIHHLSVSY
ncbi:hypothetical protein BKA70DRAFT_1279078, partial [Coprinopsis sp. MPI-PUGE-AT-0042]